MQPMPRAADTRAAAFASEARRTTDETIVQLGGADAHKVTWRRPTVQPVPKPCPLKCPLARLCSRLQRVKLGSQQPLEATPYTSGFRESAMH